jgi:hypothetical protein
MSLLLFLFAAANTVLAYVAIGAGWERWQRGSFLRRLARKGESIKRPEDQPRLIRADDRSGRLVATRALERLRAKPRR